MPTQLQLQQLIGTNNSNAVVVRGSSSAAEPDNSFPDDTELLDRLALAGGAIVLEPRAYHRRGTWKLTRNNTNVRGVTGLTRLVVHAVNSTT
jgi:hypothetical protein